MVTTIVGLWVGMVTVAVSIVISRMGSSSVEVNEILRSSIENIRHPKPPPHTPEMQRGADMQQIRPV